jgi:hypothetical protein
MDSAVAFLAVGALLQFCSREALGPGPMAPLLADAE